jgi:hypothetical protein
MSSSSIFDQETQVLDNLDNYSYETSESERLSQKKRRRRESKNQDELQSQEVVIVSLTLKVEQLRDYAQKLCDLLCETRLELNGLLEKQRNNR